ncbi:hypothetical protein Rcae01_06566 [Novipirellula caenicola]|uniref:Uncharacterized protein n=1 Tax=Novipirellula caenicola TaxID=1536901 RepID=A0ABP9W3E3_9BACT
MMDFLVRQWRIRRTRKSIVRIKQQVVDEFRYLVSRSMRLQTTVSSDSELASQPLFFDRETELAYSFAIDLVMTQCQFGLAILSLGFDLP